MAVVVFLTRDADKNHERDDSFTSLHLAGGTSLPVITRFRFGMV
jgi:hypothetical protein